MIPHPRSLIENALTAAFREVIGWCPLKDGTPKGSCFENLQVDNHTHRSAPIPKTEVYATEQIDPSQPLPRCTYVYASQRCENGHRLSSSRQLCSMHRYLADFGSANLHTWAAE